MAFLPNLTKNSKVTKTGGETSIALSVQETLIIIDCIVGEHIIYMYGFAIFLIQIRGDRLLLFLPLTKCSVPFS